jgi:hypothetical protein
VEHRLRVELEFVGGRAESERFIESKRLKTKGTDVHGCLGPDRFSVGGWGAFNFGLGFRLMVSSRPRLSPKGMRINENPCQESEISCVWINLGRGRVRMRIGGAQCRHHRDKAVRIRLKRTDRLAKCPMTCYDGSILRLIRVSIRRPRCDVQLRAEGAGPKSMRPFPSVDHRLVLEEGGGLRFYVAPDFGVHSTRQFGRMRIFAVPFFSGSRASTGGWYLTGGNTSEAWPSSSQRPSIKRRIERSQQTCFHPANISAPPHFVLFFVDFSF